MGDKKTDRGGDLLSYIEAILMGALQGVAEFLPISSSGHLVLFGHFFQVENYEETQMFFTVLLHLGTLISVFAYYWRDVLDMIREFFALLAGLFRHKDRGEAGAVPPARRLVLLIIVATLPLFVVLPVKDLVESAMSNVIFVAAALLVTGFILFFADRVAGGGKTAKNATILDAVLVGCAQAVGTLPGISRSGVTISAGLLRGYDRAFAVRFSFLMSMPAVLGANLLSLVDVLKDGGIDASLLPVYLVGTVVAAVVGYLAIGLVNLLAKKGKFGAFAWYCWVAGGVSLAAILFL